MISVYDYSDYRLFLRDHQAMKSTQNRSFSWRYYAQKAGINSTSFYTQVVKGKRNLTKETILKTCIAFALGDEEAEYFENLVSFNQAKSVKAQQIFFEKIIEQQKIRNIKHLKEEQFEYLSQWYHSAIREAVLIYDFKGNYAALGQFLKPSIPAKAAQDSVELLLKLGFLTHDNDVFVQTEPVLSSSHQNNFSSHQVVNYQIEMLQMAIASFDRWKPRQRLSSSTTMSVTKESYSQAVDIIRDCRSKLMKLALNTTVAEQVYMLNINLFPLSDHHEE
ncbi:MAG: TIGR02147 family protein [Fibrobacterales bacterium]